MKALDIVKTPKGNYAIIQETINNGQKASIIFLDATIYHGEHNAWWDKNELQVINSLPRLLAFGLRHPFGNGDDDAHKYFPISEEP